jgi:alkylated DNA repair dioxygenase AlkB
MKRYRLADGGEVLLDERYGVPDPFDQVYQEVDWAQETIRIAGRDVLQPRLTAWHGDQDAVYTYSGLTNVPRPWTESLLAIRERLQQDLKTSFNSVLCNLYRDGFDSMGWHADKEKELGLEPVIASISLGATRRFQLRHRKSGERVEFALGGGALLVMRGTTQHHWRHRIPKEHEPVGGRINLTYRFVAPTPGALMVSALPPHEATARPKRSAT